MRESRNIVVPVVNPDGFNASRTAPARSAAPTAAATSRFPTRRTSSSAAAPAASTAARTAACPTDSEDGNCATSVGLAEPGVDPNRNYGGLWGGPGADQTNPLVQTYPGPGPFSEPETRNIKALVGGNQVVTLITNHTTAGLVLRAPGLASLGAPVDEDRGYKALGDDMALAERVLQPEVLRAVRHDRHDRGLDLQHRGRLRLHVRDLLRQPELRDGRLRRPGVPPDVRDDGQGVGRVERSVQPRQRPGPSETAPFGMQPGFDGGGNREAYYIAAESTLNEARHSIIEGEAPAGATLRIRKDFKTETFPQADGNPILFDDSLESSIQVGADGRFRWHTNPSTRPIVAKERGDQGGGEPVPAGGAVRRARRGSGTDTADDDDVAAPCGDVTRRRPGVLERARHQGPRDRRQPLARTSAIVVADARERLGRQALRGHEHQQRRRPG